MAQLAFSIPIFIASPSDVAHERDIAEDVIREVSERTAQHRLLLQPIRWERVGRPNRARPQSQINEHIKEAELVVAILWSTLGSPSHADSEETGMQEELRLAGKLVERREIDDIMLYFKQASMPSDASPTRETASLLRARRVAEFRESIRESRSQWVQDFASDQEFREQFRRHLNRWIDRWIGTPEICELTLLSSQPQPRQTKHLAENRIHVLYQSFDPLRSPALTCELGRVAVRMHQTAGPSGWNREIPGQLLGESEIASLVDLSQGSTAYLLDGLGWLPSPAKIMPLTRASSGGLRFASIDWYAYFCAIGLIEAIRGDDPTAMERYIYTNEVHQYLRLLLVPNGEPDRGALDVLTSWLRGAGCAQNRPIARNFAAYVLGMIGATSAEDVLADAAWTDPGEGVQHYSICALGKMRSRKHLARLVRLYHKVTDDRMRMTIGQAICRITGVAHYEL